MRKTEFWSLLGCNDIGTRYHIAKTRIQSTKVIDGKPEYKNALDVWAKVIRNKGFFALWKGFTPYYMRLGPHNVLTFIISEQMNAAFI